MMGSVAWRKRFKGESVVAKDDRGKMKKERLPFTRKGSRGAAS